MPADSSLDLLQHRLVQLEKDFERLQTAHRQQEEKLRSELDKAKLDAKNEIKDLAAGQSIRITDVHAQVNRFIPSIQVGLAFAGVIIAGVGTYAWFSVKAETIKAAENEIKRWTKSEGEKLISELFERKSEDFYRSIRDSREEISIKSRDSINDYLNNKNNSVTNTDEISKSKQNSLISDENINLTLIEKKPITQRSISEWQALLAYAVRQKNYSSAVEMATTILALPNLQPLDQAVTLFIRGNALTNLNQWKQAIASYDELLRRFGSSSEPAVREQVARSLTFKGIALGPGLITNS